MRDIRHILWKEWRLFLRVDGGGAALFARLVLLGILAHLFVSVLGPGFGSDPGTMGLVSFIACLGALPSVSDSFAGEREQRTLESLIATPVSDGALLFGKLLAVVTFGWTAGVIVLMCGLPLAKLRFGSESQGMDPLMLVYTLVVSFLVATGVSALGVAVSVRASTVKDANQILGGVFILGSVLPFLVAELVPEAIVAAYVPSMEDFSLMSAAPYLIVQLIVMDVALMALAAALYRRARLAWNL